MVSPDARRSFAEEAHSGGSSTSNKISDTGTGSFVAGTMIFYIVLLIQRLWHPRMQ
jgi:hypothetical protein